MAMAEGDAGQGAFQFTVTLDRPQSSPVTVGFAAADRAATAPAAHAREQRPRAPPSDDEATTGTVTSDPGEAAKTATVQVNGNGTVEPNETYNVNR